MLHYYYFHFSVLIILYQATCLRQSGNWYICSLLLIHHHHSVYSPLALSPCGCCSCCCCFDPCRNWLLVTLCALSAPPSITSSSPTLPVTTAAQEAGSHTERSLLFRFSCVLNYSNLRYVQKDDLQEYCNNYIRNDI